MAELIKCSGCGKGFKNDDPLYVVEKGRVESMGGQHQIVLIPVQQEAVYYCTTCMCLPRVVWDEAGREEDE